GFPAPTVSGVAAAASAALAVADVDPGSVSFVEAHGTGTPVGDPIEVRGLTRAYQAGRQPGTDRTLLGSIKPATGHTDAAAGVLGLIKVVMSLQNQVIPATLHYRTPNPELQLETSPFRISGTVEPWPRSAEPRRAGVNSMGLGGTNVHVIVQESPEPTDHARPGKSAWSHQLLPFSARTPAALADMAGRITDWLADRADTDTELADAAWTLQTGRGEFRYRSFVVAADGRPAADQSARPARSTRPVPDNPPDVVFLFPGQGGQHIGMGRELYRDHAGFRADLDACAELAADRLQLDLRTVLFADEVDPASAGSAGQAAVQLARMQVAQPIVFAVEYALARLWQSWGIRPAAVAGHSLGAYAAATLAGVLSLPDAMQLILTRSEILDRAPDGAMLAIPVPVERVEGWLGLDLSLAAVNGPEQCVVAGTRAAITSLEERCQADGIDARILRISAAAHSHLIEPFCLDYEKAVAEVTLNPPQLRWLSDQTGDPVTAAEATDPSYWSSHLRHTVNFSAVLDTVTRDSAAVLLEVGPGRTLSSLARQHPGHTEHQPVIASLPSAHDEVAEPAFLLTAAGQLWQSGVAIDWTAVHEGETRRRVTTLPTYPFQRRRFRLDAGTAEAMLPQAPAEPAADDQAARWETPTQAAVAAAFTTILGAEPEHAEVDFFELGGDSLLASRVAARLRRELQVEIGFRAVFGSPTVAGLSAYLDAKLAQA
ncbi:MAG: phthiocerol/phenolphthiocerol synthesis type-I polyketide synthase, partial [Pseudonocardiales bacterium]|nr:phthiocerol/phenolphthiocerol synthesis type-I polyketide synthase [Pseudonocardiales bacterium]